MRRKMSYFLILLVVCLAALPLSVSLAGGLGAILPAPDAPTAAFSIPWWSVDGGGGTSQGGIYALNGGAGQPDAAFSTGGVYALQGGFFSGTNPYKMYMPRLSR
jgi:hypothetical protein